MHVAASATSAVNMRIHRVSERDSSTRMPVPRTSIRKIRIGICRPRAHASRRSQDRTARSRPDDQAHIPRNKFIVVRTSRAGVAGDEIPSTIDLNAAKSPGAVVALYPIIDAGDENICASRAAVGIAVAHVSTNDALGVASNTPQVPELDRAVFYDASAGCNDVKGLIEIG